MVGILEYLNSTRDVGITYKHSAVEGLLVYADADYADSEKRRSVTEGVLAYVGAVVVGVSRTKGVVSLFSTETGYVAAEEVTKEALLVRGILKFVQLNVEKCTKVSKDNQGVIQLSYNPLRCGRDKHTDVHHNTLVSKSVLRRSPARVRTV